MSITAGDLVAKITEKCQQSDELECAIVKADGIIVCINIEKRARELSKILDMFGGIIPREPKA